MSTWDVSFAGLGLRSEDRSEWTNLLGCVRRLREKLHNALRDYKDRLGTDDARVLYVEKLGSWLDSEGERLLSFIRQRILLARGSQMLEQMCTVMVAGLEWMDTIRERPRDTEEDWDDFLDGTLAVLVSLKESFATFDVMPVITSSHEVWRVGDVTDVFLGGAAA